MGDIFLQAMIIAKAKKGVYLKAPIAAGARAALPRFSSRSGVPKRNLSIYVLHWSREPELSGICRGIFAFFAALGRLHLCRKAESFALWLSNPFALEKYCAHSVPNLPMPVRKMRA